MDELTLSIGDLARRTGVDIPTLRRWERYEGLLAPTRTPGGQRRYGAGDVAAIQELVSLIGKGWAAASAAQAVADHRDTGVRRLRRLAPRRRPDRRHRHERRDPGALRQPGHRRHPRRHAGGPRGCRRRRLPRVGGAPARARRLQRDAARRAADLRRPTPHPPRRPRRRQRGRRTSPRTGRPGARDRRRLPRSDPDAGPRSGGPSSSRRSSTRPTRRSSPSTPTSGSSPGTPPRPRARRPSCRWAMRSRGRSRQDLAAPTTAAVRRALAGEPSVFELRAHDPEAPGGGEPKQVHVRPLAPDGAVVVVVDVVDEPDRDIGRGHGAPPITGSSPR